jgi:DNA-binding response OmpR family regulator
MHKQATNAWLADCSSLHENGSYRRGSHQEVLVVEAEPDLGPLFQQALADLGYVSTLASSLDQALHLVQERSFDLIITDAYPSTSRDVLKSLRPLLGLANPVPVILCTAWRVEEAVARQAGCAALIQQPFDLNELVTTVTGCLMPPRTPDAANQGCVAKCFT